MPSNMLVGPKCNCRVSCDGDPRFDGLLAVDPTDPTHMVGVCRVFENPPQFDSELAVQVTFDGGRSWQEKMLAAPGGYSTSDPWIGIAPNGKDVYVIALKVETLVAGDKGPASMGGEEVLFYSSSDEGETWQGPSQLHPNATFSSTDTLEGTSGAVDLSTQGTGRSYPGRIYAVWNRNTKTGKFPALARSDDGGQSWQRSSSAGATTFEWSHATTGIKDWDHLKIAVGPDGTVHIASRVEDDTAVAYARSTDGGNNFTWRVVANPDFGSEEQIPELYGVANQTFSTVQQLALAAGPNQALAIAWCVDTGTLPGHPETEVLVVQCDDGGQGWSSGGGFAAGQSALLPLTKLALPDNDTDFYFKPQLAFALDDGTLGCFAYHAGSQAASGSPPSYGPIDGYLWVTEPGGQVFEAAAGVLTQAFDPTANVIKTWNEPGSVYDGSLTGLGASPLGFFPYWSDTRQNGPLLPASARLFVSRLALNPADIYLHHFEKDDGTLGAPSPPESYFDSPDLVVRLQQDGEANFSNQQVPADITTAVYIYGRVWNKGPNEANNITLSACIAEYKGPGTIWLYPHDWFNQDWRLAPDQESHLALSPVTPSAATFAGPLAVGASKILGPIEIPAGDLQKWSAAGHPCILAKVECDNDDSNGGASGCAIPEALNSCGAGAYFWGTNNACQRNVTLITFNPVGGWLHNLHLFAGNPQSQSEEIGLVFEPIGHLKGIPIRLRLKGSPKLKAEGMKDASPSRDGWSLEGKRPALRFGVKRGTRLEFEMSLELPPHEPGQDFGALRVSQVGPEGQFRGGIEFIFRADGKASTG